MSRRTSRAILGSVSVLALLSPLGASAQTATADNGQTATSGGLQEIVVTATRREERLQDVPISVAAFSQEKMDEQGLRNIDDLSRLSPGVAFQRNGMSSAGNYNDEGSDINIRGVDSTAGTSTTGIYIDDTPIQTRHIGFGSINAFPALFDLDRVEVLRGPQGTLFGAGAEGGVVRFIAPEANLHTPTGYFRADAAATQYGSPSYEGGAAFGAPIIDDVLAFRASASFRRDGGWVDRVGYTLSDPAAPTPTPSYSNTTQPNANYWETTTARLALRWKVNDAVEISPSIYYQRLQIHDTAAYWMPLSDPGNGVFRNGNALTNPSNDAFTLTAVKLKWDLGFAQLFSNTAYYDRNQNAVSDYTQYLRATWALYGELPNTFPAAGDKGYANFQDNQRNFYEEIRLASSDPNATFVWNTGVFFSHLKESVPESIYDPTINQEVINYTGGAASVCVPGVPALECPGGLIYYGPGDQVVDKQIAIFGELTYKFLDVFKATVGLRLSRLDFSGLVNETGPFLGATIVGSSSSSEKPVTPKVLFSWQPDHDNMYYISATKGFRPGGPNFPVGQLCQGNLQSLGLGAQVPNQYSSDNLWSYEIGGKSTLLDHRLQINASLFYIDWNNIQQNVYLPDCGEQFTANLGKAKSEGGDIEILYRPIDPLTLDLSAAYTDARLTKSSCAGTLQYTSAGCVAPGAAASTATAPVASSGDALLGAPWSFTTSAQYEFPKWSGSSPYLRLDYQHETAQHSLLATQDPHNALFDTTIPGLPVVNNLSARAGARYNGLDVSLYANNLTNSQPLMFESRDIADSLTDLLYFGRGVRPRTYGVTAIYRY
ncbi:MAG TPA: TonB-dependent receptor [Steroidobacteraceae bacterium]|nr:TonB-dependent receptor [Steroidobacteraceae bacterium]